MNELARRRRAEEEEAEQRAEQPQARPALGNQALQRLAPHQLARLAGLGNQATQQLARNGTYPSKEGTEKVLTPPGSGTAMPVDYRQWLYPGGRVYMRDRKNPLTRLDTGWTRDGYDDIVKHATEDQGRGSSWVSTSESFNAVDPGYGQFVYEIELNGFQGIDVNTAVEKLTKHKNPHFLQREIAVYKRLPPDCIKAVWVKRAAIKKTVVGEQYGYGFADEHERYTPDQYREAFKQGEFAHITFS